MHDCPGCRVPLHGWEEVCPSCGTKQYVRKSFRFLSHGPEEPGVNLMPFIVAFILVGIFIFSFLPNSWIGHLMKPNNQASNPLEKINYVEARQMVESKLLEGLQADGAKATFKWREPGDEKEMDKAADKSIELVIDTSLSKPEIRKTIIDPVKPYMEKAKIVTLTMNDAKSHATWTYNMTPAFVPTEPDEFNDVLPNEHKE
jgi:hypothetical protein